MSLASMFRNEPEIVTLAAGDTLFAAGDPPDAMYVILEGELDIQLEGHALDIAHEGEIVGEMALIDHQGRSAAVAARTAARLARIDKKRFLYLVQNTPTFALDVMTIMAARIRRFDIAVSTEGFAP
jgi:CRP-like cAMP-binding protein